MEVNHEPENVVSVGGNEPKSDYTTIKRTLNSILRGPNKQLIITAIKKRVDTCTRISVIASLLVLYRVNCAIDNGNLEFFNINSGQFIRECFFSVTEGSADPLPDEFAELLNMNNIQRPSTAFLDNLLEYTITTYRTNFMNNIQMHCRSRMKLFFNICFKENEENVRYDADEIENTLTFMFNSEIDPLSEKKPNIELIMKIPYIAELNLEEDRGGYKAGFFYKLIYNNWFKAVPIFIGIQDVIENYQFLCEEPGNAGWKNISNFVTVPLHSHAQKSVRLDNSALFALFKELNIDKKMPSKRNASGQRRMTNTEFMSKKRHYWMGSKPDYQGPFDPKKFRRMEKRNKQFEFQIVTDGIAASILFSNKRKNRPVISEEMHEKNIRRRYLNDQYVRKIGVDPGYNIWLAAVIKYNNGEEDNFKLKSKEFHALTGMKRRKRKRKRLTDAFENKAAQDRKRYPMCSAAGTHWRNYLLHRLTVFNDGIATYSNEKLRRLDLEKYFCTQRAIDKVVNKLVGNDRSLLCFGAADFKPNSPIKGYIRCPGTKTVERFVKKKRNVDVLKVDEYRTSQVCGRCLQDFKQPLNTIYEKRKHRFRQCTNCRRNNDIVPPPTAIISDKNRRKFRSERREHPMGPITKKIRIVPTNQAVFGNVDGRWAPITQTIINRDISSALLMLVKSDCWVKRLPIPERISRRAMKIIRERNAA